MNKPETYLPTLSTFSQIDKFKELSKDKQTLQLILKLDSYAQPRAFEYLPKNERTMANLMQLKIYDRWYAFQFLSPEEINIENLKLLPEQNQWQAFQFLNKNDRIIKNLKLLPEKNWPDAFQYLGKCKLSKLKELPWKYRKKALEKLPLHKREKYKLNKEKTLKKINTALKFIAGTVLILTSAILAFLFFPQITLLIGSILSTTKYLPQIISYATIGLPALIGIILNINGIKKISEIKELTKTSKTKKLNQNPPNTEDKQKKDLSKKQNEPTPALQTPSEKNNQITH